jgi:hypothetical protein
MVREDSRKEFSSAIRAVAPAPGKQRERFVGSMTTEDPGGAAKRHGEVVFNHVLASANDGGKSMKRFVLFATMSLALLLAVNAVAAGDRTFQLTEGGRGMLYGGSDMGKAARDTTWLLGGPAAYTGKFQDASGNANWQGWTHVDYTFSGEQRWNVSTFHSPTGTQAMWCGKTFPAPCLEGYGNGWHENLVFTYTVANAAVNTVARLQCVYSWDTEVGYDYFRIQQNRGGTWETVIEHDGVGTANFDQNITFTPSDYVGPSGNQLELRFQGFSDGAYSDEDGGCSSGLAQVDNIRVTIGANVWYDDMEDGQIHNWHQVFDVAVGDYAKIWSGLQDVDPCVVNSSPQVAFVDDGVVVPGTGGTPCQSWCYGPGGYIVNNTGGLVGPASHLDNLLISPVLNWPAGNDGAILTYDVYRHEDIIVHNTAGIFYQWHVRSINENDPGHPALDAAAWQDRNHVYYGRSYLSDIEPVTDLLVPGRTKVQIGLRCIEYGWVWNYDGTDGTPAPYFDNVAFKVFPFNTPSIAFREIDLPNDNFPERGDIDLVNLANNWVRFDMSRNISPATHQRNDPGDSVFVDIGLPRAGSVLNNMPKLVVKMKANPLFNGVRVLPAGFTNTAGIIDGFVYGDSTHSANGSLVANRYNFDLPDSNFFFPGDVIHYYIEAKDNLNGNVGTATLPGDISNIGDFDSYLPYGYQSSFIVHALPTLYNAAGQQPRILFWNDFANRGGENEWYAALNNLGYNAGSDYDIYYTMGPSSGVGNGLGGRATPQTIGGYNTLLYTSGDLGTLTLGNNDYASDPSNDIGVLTNWFGQGGKKAFMTGDDLVASLTTTGAGLAFMNSYFSVRFVNGNILPLINNQTAPRVQPVAGNSVFTTPDEWIAFGGCLSINDFDAIETNGTAQRLARFLNPGGSQAYTYAAATRYVGQADVILMPYDFMYIYNPANYTPSVPGYNVRTEIMRDILIGFGHIPHGTVIDVPDGGMVFGVSNFPNPFNPTTEIKMTLPNPGHVSLKVFNVRGELVRTLVNGELAAGPQSIMWNGTNDSGSGVASGVYFYETKYNGETLINKMALVK